MRYLTGILLLSFILWGAYNMITLFDTPVKKPSYNIGYGSNNILLKANGALPNINISTSEEIYASLLSNEIQILEDGAIYNSASLRAKTTTIGGNNRYAGLYLASGDTNGINIVSKDVTAPIFEIFNSTDYLSIVPNLISIRDGTIPVYRGSNASAPSDPVAGDEYWDTTFLGYYKHNGSEWISVADSLHVHEIESVLIEYVIDGHGSAITTGSKGYFSVPVDCTLTSNFIIADQSGSIVIDIKKTTYNDFPTTTSITASAKPTLTTEQKSTDTTLTGWTTALNAGDILEFVVDSATTVTRINIVLNITGTGGYMA